MTQLEKLEEELYGKDERPLAKRRRVILPRDGATEQVPTSWVERPKEPVAISAIVSGKIITFLVGFGVIAFIAIAALVTFFYLRTKGSEAELAIYGRDSVEAGETVTVPITFRNTSRTALLSPELTVVLPPGTTVTENGVETPAPPRISKMLNDIQPGAEGTVEITARFFGKENEEKLVAATLLYRPENLSARFSAKQTKSIRIASVPLAITWDMPETVSQGQDVSFTIHYVSNARSAFENLTLQVSYPPGFTFTSAEPAPSFEQTAWTIGTLAPGGDGSIVIHGKITGEQAEVKSFQAGIGILDTVTREWQAYYESSHDASLAVTPLSIEGFLAGARDGFVRPGDRLNFTLHYKNNTNTALRNVSIRSSVETRSGAGAEAGFLDPSSIAIDSGGVFDTASGEILWAPGGTKELGEIAPGADGTVAFSIASKARPPMRDARSTNFVVHLHASIDVANAPERFAGRTVRDEDALDFKVSSVVLFAARALYRSTPLSNSGPLPPRAGEKTTYTILWEVRDFTNALANAMVMTTLPPNVKWEQALSPSDAHITYDPASGNVQWFIGELKAGTGVVTPARIGAFRVSITPGPSDKGQIIPLAQESVLTGDDTFTSEKHDERVHALTTEIREDPLTSVGDWTVAQ